MSFRELISYRLQISIGVAWFSFVAAEMVSGDPGLGYLIVDAYMNNVTVPMVIGMITLGFIGYITSVMVRIVGDLLMQWQVRELAQQIANSVCYRLQRIKVMTKQNASKNGTVATKGAISIRNVTKIYDPEGVNVKAVDNCSMEIAGGGAFVGPSGWQIYFAERDCWFSINHRWSN